MTFDRKGLKKQRFKGFYTIEDLKRGRMEYIPQSAGVYLVLRELDAEPKFLDRNPGGKFKGMDPTVWKNKLQKKWVDKARVIYIGKGDNLRSRIDQFLKFGARKPTPHWGGKAYLADRRF